MDQEITFLGFIYIFLKNNYLKKKYKYYVWTEKK